MSPPPAPSPWPGHPPGCHQGPRQSCGPASLLLWKAKGGRLESLSHPQSKRWRPRLHTQASCSSAPHTHSVPALAPRWDHSDEGCLTQSKHPCKSTFTPTPSLPPSAAPQHCNRQYPRQLPPPGLHTAPALTIPPSTALPSNSVCLTSLPHHPLHAAQAPINSTAPSWVIRPQTTLLPYRPSTRPSPPADPRLGAGALTSELPRPPSRLSVPSPPPPVPPQCRRRPPHPQAPIPPCHHAPSPAPPPASRTPPLPYPLPQLSPLRPSAPLLPGCSLPPRSALSSPGLPSYTGTTRPAAPQALPSARSRATRPGLWHSFAPRQPAPPAPPAARRRPGPEPPPPPSPPRSGQARPGPPVPTRRPRPRT